MKKLNQKGFTHHLLIFALLALVVGAAGFAGWRIYKNKNIDAQAAGWTLIGGRSSDSTYPALLACKLSSGTYWYVKTRLYNPTNYYVVKKVYLYNTVGTNLSGTYGQTVGPKSWGATQTMRAKKSDSPIISLQFYGVSSPNIKDEASIFLGSVESC